MPDTTPTTARTTWPAAAELQQAADIRRAAGDPLVADWLDATANALAWLAPYRDNEPGYGMWQAAVAVARLVLGTTDQQPETAPADRRARYAAVIRDTDGWVLDGGQHMVDAVMAVADAEQVELRAQVANLRTMYDVADGRTSDLIDERDALRSEMERRTLMLQASRDQGAKLRADRATVRAVIRRLAAHAVGFQDVLDEGDQGAWGKTIGADIAELRRLADEAQQPETEAVAHVVGGDSVDPECIDDCPGCEAFSLTGHVAADQPDTETEARTGDDRCPGFCIPCMTDESHHPATEETTR
ncbi:hypothetical protein AB0I93_26910 [Streptomyces sp. NPDC049967]|uniref:hypothetical protein n=1 Tax=Streptomyces sp. NPDC049967 TaxID=3155658 RepID=UPI003424AC86